MRGASLQMFREMGDRFGLVLALQMLSLAKFSRGHFDEAAELIAELIQAATETKQMDKVSPAYVDMANIRIIRGQFQDAERQLAASKAVLDGLGDAAPPFRWAEYTNSLGDLARARGDLDRAEQLYHQSIVLMNDTNHLPMIGYPILNLGRVAYLRQDYEEAAQRAEEARQRFERGGAEPRAGALASNLVALVATAQGNLNQAREALAQAFSIIRGMRYPPATLETFIALADLLAAEGQIERAVELLALIESHPMTAEEFRAWVHQRLEGLEDQLDPPAFAAAIERGQALDLEAVLADQVAAYLPA
ncbi:MAG: hypothetical protein GYB68_11460 [Chloroflexi bacterium]|nr:hypothetical protein [Chloroflexota bacterium]